MFDTLSGIRDGEYPGGIPQTVVYPKSMSVIVTLDKNEKEKITVPVLRIEYRARSLQTISQGGESSLSQVTFDSDYESDAKQLNKGMHAVFYIVVVIAVISLFITTYF